MNKRAVHYSCLFLAVGCSLVSQAQSDTALIGKHLQEIVITDLPRDYRYTESLDQVAGYIHGEFAQHSADVSYQAFEVAGRTYKNVIASFAPADAGRLIIGAHYDVAGSQPGADDNASGVVGLLELARLLAKASPDYRIDLVAYTLEEPPFFRSTEMGSYRHAQMLHSTDVPVKGMIVLEMIGYFDPARGSQDYPLGLLRLFYGSRGDYITIVKKWGAGKFARKFTRKFQRHAQIDTKRFTGPKKLPGIDFSDHLNYWKFGYSALMITDTAFYRNKNYHESSDTIETLNITGMAKVIDSVYSTLFAL